jgi:hypothetical protein
VSRFVKQGTNPFTKEPFDLLDVNAFSRPRSPHRPALTLAAAVEGSDRGTRLGGLPYLAANQPWPSRDDSLVGPAVPLVATLVTETEGAPPGRRREPPLHKLGGFGDWIQVDARMYAYFDSHVPTSDPAAVNALARAGIDPGSLPGSREVLEAVSRLEALGIDASVLGRASADFELLAQIDSDEAAGLRWGDVGRLYLFVRASDARRRSFQSLVAWADSG